MRASGFSVFRTEINLKYGSTFSHIEIWKYTKSITCISYGLISDRICMFTYTRNHLVSGLLYFRPLSRYALYYYIMAENHVAENQTCLLCVIHCAVYACLQHDCLRLGLKCKPGIEFYRYVCTIR